MPRIKGVYDPSGSDDGLRVLVERLWPRGLNRDKVKVDIWLKDVAPSSELRSWFSLVAVCSSDELPAGVITKADVVRHISR